MHDEQCTNGNIVFQPKLHLQQTLPLLCPKPYKHPKTTKLNLNTTKEKDSGTLLCHHFLLKQIKEGHGVVFFFLYLKHKEDETHKKTTKKQNQKKGGSLPSSSRSAFSLLVFASAFLFLHFRFMCFLLTSSSFQVVRKKKHKEKKTINKKKHVKKGRSLPLSSYSALSLLTLAFAFLFYTFILSVLSWHFLFIK